MKIKIRLIVCLFVLEGNISTKFRQLVSRYCYLVGISRVTKQDTSNRSTLPNIQHYFKMLSGWPRGGGGALCIVGR